MKVIKANMDCAMKRRPSLDDKGFTLIELLVAMAVSSVVAMAGFALFSTTNWSYQIQEDVGEAQQSGRIAVDRIARDLRSAGFGLPDSSTDLIIGSGQTASPALNSPIMFSIDGSTSGPDEITIVGIGYRAGKLFGTNNKEQEWICYKKTTDEEKFFNASQLASTRRYISIDGIFFAELATGAAKVGCSGGIKLPLANPDQLKKNWLAGTVYIIQAVKYSIVDDTPDSKPACTPETPCLKSQDYTTLRGGDTQIMAENIEDLQFAYGMDDGGVVKDTNGDGVYTAADFLDTPTDGGKILAVRVTVSVKTRRKDPRGHSFKRPAIENRAAASETDNYRRRIYTRIVRMRN